jgi:hypothetical protein
MWFDEERLPGKLPQRQQILLCLLTVPLEVLELRGIRFREVSVDAGGVNEGVDVLADELWMGYGDTLLFAAPGSAR